MRTSMKAIVIERPGPPEVLRLQQRPVPKPKPGWVLIRVRAFGLNRSELFTRQGHSPAVTFPRIVRFSIFADTVSTGVRPETGVRLCMCLWSENPLR